ncbi:hypothetical protein LCGC14_1458360 [marine sediment metagenome]|uniref:Uncharacterized protein n=1 Tax=marine sediment metagenome TaxID=412755 RepID=A0A0F9MHS3_9ZZZZ
MVSFSQEQIQKKEVERKVLQTQVKGLQDLLQQRKLARPGEKFPALRQSINQQGGRADQLGIDISILQNLQRQIEGAEQRGETISQAEQQRVFGSEVARVGRAKTLSLVAERAAQARAIQLRQEAKKVGFTPVRVRGVQRFIEIKTGRVVSRLPTIRRRVLPPRKIVPILRRVEERRIIFGDPVSFGRSFNRATGSNTFTIAVPIRRENGKIRVQDFNFRFENGRLISSRRTGTALLTKQQFLKADERRRIKTPGFTFGSTISLKRPVVIKEKITEKEVSEILQLSIDPSLKFFNKQQLREEAGLRQTIDNFSQQRLNFYQGQIDKGILSVDNANKLLEKDIDNKINSEVEKSAFFKTDGASKRDPTLTRLAFGYETNRLESIKSLNQAKTKSSKAFFKTQAGTRRFLRNVADAPSSFIELGKATANLIKNPENFIPLAASIRASITKNNLVLTGSKIKNFVITRPGEAIAEVAGTILIFATVAKGLKLVGQLSKPASRNIIKKLKINAGLKGSLKGITSVSITVPKEVAKATGIITKIPSTKITRAFAKSFKEAAKGTATAKQIAKAKAKVVKIRRAVSGKEIRIRVKKGSLIGRVELRLRRRKIAREKILLRRRVKKRRIQREKRRLKLLKEKRRKAKITKLKKAKEKIKAKIKRKPIIKKIEIKRLELKARKKRKLLLKKKKRLELKAEKEKKLMLERTRKRKKEREERRKKLLKKQEFEKRLGKNEAERQLKKARKKLRGLKKLVDKFDNPDILPKNIFKKLVSKLRGIKKVELGDIKKLTSTQKLALGRLKSNLEKKLKKQLVKIKRRQLNSQKILKQFRRSKQLPRQQKKIKKIFSKIEKIDKRLPKSVIKRIKFQVKKIRSKIEKGEEIKLTKLGQDFLKHIQNIRNMIVHNMVDLI